MPPTPPKPLQLPAKPWWFRPAPSTRKTMDVVYSPPTESPWIMRRTTSSTAAAGPSVS
jgi:hypothetical protein